MACTRRFNDGWNTDLGAEISVQQSPGLKRLRSSPERHVRQAKEYELSAESAL